MAHKPQQLITEVEQWADELPMAYLLCRDLNHNWKPWNAVIRRNGGQPFYERTLRCANCKLPRIQTLSMNGRVLTDRRDYTQVPGYLAKGLGRITGENKDAVRLASILRKFDVKEVDDVDSTTG
jgi:hypothetical protein